MADQPRVILSGFADEAANQKTAVQQFAAFAALGLQYYSIRFIDVGEGVKNVMKLTRAEIQKVRHLEDEYGLNVASIGSPIGKVKLSNVDDGTKNAYVPFKRYLQTEVKKVCAWLTPSRPSSSAGSPSTIRKGAKPLHGASGGSAWPDCRDVPPLRSDVWRRSRDEPGRVQWPFAGRDHRQVNHPGAGHGVRCRQPDRARLLGQRGLEQLEAMLPGLGWVHIKDYRHPKPVNLAAHVNEDVLANFVPADRGDAAHETILRRLRRSCPSWKAGCTAAASRACFSTSSRTSRGAGNSAASAARTGWPWRCALCKVLDYVEIGYHLRDFEDIKAARGF